MNNIIKVAVTGANGRMGRGVVELIEDRDNLELECVFDTSEGYNNPDSFSDKASGTDVVIDFTNADSCIFYAQKCLENDLAFVTGTTGLTNDQLGILEDISDKIPVLKASNFSRGVAVLKNLVEDASESLDNFEVEIIEHHHSNKKDSPSGTAKMLAKAVEKTRKISRKIYGREGFSERESSEIGIHSVRAGGIKGRHQVLFASENEKLSLSHESSSRKVFAEGAIDSAVWLADRKHGYYNFQNVIGS